MYGIPKELDLSPIVGKFTTQLRVGQFDIQFDFGEVHFSVESPITLRRNEKAFARWEEGRWPDAGFYEIMNTEITQCRIASDKLIVIGFANGIEMRLEDNSDRYESMTISFKGTGAEWII